MRSPPESTALFLILLFASSALQAGGDRDTSSFFFYRPYDYGTQATFNPGNVIVNGGYGIWQVATELYSRKILEFKYRESSRALWDDVKNPFKTVREFGTRRFFLTEVIPASFDPTNQQYFPNYGLHCIGAGMLFRKTEEWYRYYGYPAPRLFSVATMAAYHWLTEVIEFGPDPHLSVDPVADLWIMNPLGILLFMSDRVCGFFSGRLRLNEWSLQPAYNAATGNLENMGQFYALKFPVVKDGRWSLFGRAGLHEMAGVSRTWNNGRCVTLAAGAGVESIVKADQQGPGLAQTATWMWSGAVFYDVNNSLAASLVATGMPQDRVRINLYPGLLRLGPVSPGLFFAWTKEAVLGITIRYSPLGIAASGGSIPP